MSNLIKVALVAQIPDSSCDHQKLLKLLYSNAQSCRQKAIEIHDLIVDSNIDLDFMTETWLYEQGDEAYIADLTPSGYEFYSFPRTGKRGGGIAIVAKVSVGKLTAKPLDSYVFEVVVAKLVKGNWSASFTCLNHTPPNKKNTSTNKMFVDQFPDLLTECINASKNFILLGDFNFHFVDPSCPYVKKLSTIINDIILQIWSENTSFFQQ